jgi:hypothetical protein
MKQFRDLAQKQGWKSQDDSYCFALKKLKSALVIEFNQIYGTNDKDILAWQALCRVIGIPVQNTLEGCQKVS